MTTNSLPLADDPGMTDSSQLAESQRLAALYQLYLLDTPGEERFDRIVRTAARLFNVPMSAIKLIDADREWTKAATPGYPCAVSRRGSFGSHTIADRRGLVVPDTLIDPRFANNLCVVGSPHVRFYAGLPLAAADGSLVGALCIMDTKPRNFSAEDWQALDDLAGWAESEINTLSLHQTVAELRDRELKLRDITDYTTDAIYIKDREGRYLFMNAAGLRTWGFTAESLYGSYPSQVFYDEMGKEIQSNDRLVLESGQPITYETTMSTKQGLRTFFTTKAPYLRDGQICGLIGITRDITERKQVEEALRESQRFAERVADTLPSILYIYDTIDNRNIYVNRQIGQILGYSSEEIQAMGAALFANLVHPDDLAILAASAARMNSSSDDRVSDTEYRMRHRSGEWRWLRSWDTVFTRDPDGQLRQIVGIAQDVTEAKRIREELQQARDQAVETTRLKSEFLANMSHEIRTPMTAILSMTEMLLEASSTLNEPQREMVHTIQYGGNLLLRLVNDILDLSKIEAQKLILEEIDFDPAQVIRDIVNLLSVRARNKNLSLRAQTDPQLPKLVQGDPTRLRQVLLNLTDNALKFTERGTVKLCVHVENIQQERISLRFGVKDTGIGLSESARERLFQPFTQAESETTRKYGGTGLGLAISQRLVELMGGSIEVESQEGVGTTIWVRLTLGCSPANPLVILPSAQITPVMQADPVAPIDVSSARILLVEDNAVNQRVALFQLRKLGYSADCALTGIEAVNALRRQSYDLVLMDCQMPEMDGFAATAAIRSRELSTDSRRVVIIAMTATYPDTGPNAFFRAGMDGHLLKPVKLAELKSVLDHWLPSGHPISQFPPLVENPRSKMVDTPIIDNTAISAMRELVGDDPKALASLLESFTTSTDALLQKLRLAANSPRDDNAILFLAHTLKSSSAICGAAGVTAICVHLEAATRHGDFQEAADWIAALDTEYERFKVALHAQTSS